MAQTLTSIQQGHADLQREDVFPAGNFQAWTTSDLGFIIDTATGKIVKRFRGESAWSNAARIAGDMNSEASRAERGW
jgi:hypothetical protein